MAGPSDIAAQLGALYNDAGDLIGFSGQGGIAANVGQDVVNSVRGLFPEIAKRPPPAAPQPAPTQPAVAPDDYGAMIAQAAHKYGVDPDLARAIALNGEGAGSYASPTARSPKGATGIMQVMPTTAPGVDLTDPAANIDAGVHYIKTLSDQFHGDPALTAAAYNAGPQAVTDHGGVPPFKETQAYVQRVTGALGGPPHVSQSDLDAAFKAGGSTSPGGVASADDDAPSQADLDAAMRGGASLEPGGAKLPPPSDQGSPAQALPAPNLPGFNPALTPPHGAADTLARSLGADIRGISNAVSFGLANKADAAFAALPQFIHGGVTEAAPQYTANMNAEQAQDQADAAQVPFAHYPSMILGALAGGGVFPEIKAAGLLQRAGIGAGQGALFGGLNAVGNARGGPTEMGQAAIPAMAGGAALGGPLGAVFGAAAPAVAVKAASLADHAAAGVDPMLAISGPRWLQQLGQTLKGSLAGGPLASAAERTSGQLAGAVSGAADRFGTAASPYEAGGAAVEGAQHSVDAMKAVENKLYEPLNALEATDTKIGALNTLSAIKDLYAKYPNIPDWLTKHAPAFASVQKTLAGAGGRLTFGELKSLRSDVGKLIKDQTLTTVDQARLKALYGAMSRDMEAGVATTAKAQAYKQGATPEQAVAIGQKAQAILKRANTFASAMRLRISEHLEQVLNARSNEDAFHKILAASRSGSRSDIRQLTMIKRSLDDEHWNNISAGVLNTMARDANGHFSVDRFVTELDKMTPEAKRLFFGEDADAIAAIGRVARQQKSAAKFYNHSNSGHAVLTGMLIEPILSAGGALARGDIHHAATEAGGMAGALTGGWAVSKLLASPGLARIILRAGQVKSLGEAQVMDRVITNYARAQQGPMAQLVGRYHDAWAQQVRANFGVSAGSGISQAVGERSRTAKPLEAVQ